MKKCFILITSIFLIFTSLPILSQAGDNIGEIQASVRNDGWTVAWGKHIDHIEYAKLIAAMLDISGTSVSAYLTDLVSESAKTLGMDIVIQAIKHHGKTFGAGSLELQAGIATYNHWHGENPCSLWGRTCWQRISEPNTHQPYVRWRRKGTQPSSVAGIPEWAIDHSVFDADFYLNYYGDVRSTFGSTNYAGALEHWWRNGINEGRRGSPTLDPSYYLNYYGDVKATFGSTNYAGALEHWYRNGINEGRRSSREFDVRFYLGQYGDIRSVFGSTNYAAAVEHWYRNGINEGRRGSQEFDVKFYLEQNGDLQKAFGPTNYPAAFLHWLLSGMKEGRKGAK